MRIKSGRAVQRVRNGTYTWANIPGFQDLSRSFTTSDFLSQGAPLLQWYHFCLVVVFSQLFIPSCYLPWSARLISYSRDSWETLKIHTSARQTTIFMLRKAYLTYVQCVSSYDLSLRVSLSFALETLSSKHSLPGSPLSRGLIPCISSLAHARLTLCFMTVSQSS